MIGPPSRSKGCWSATIPVGWKWSHTTAPALTFVKKLMQDDGYDPRVVAYADKGIDTSVGRYEIPPKVLYDALLDICS